MASTTNTPNNPSDHKPLNPGVSNLTPVMTPAQVTQLLHNRYTAKKYNPDMPCSDEDFHAIIEAGRMSPSSMGFEPWHFVHLKNRDIINEILPYLWGGQGKVEDASHLVLLLGREAQAMKPYSPYLTHIHEDIQRYPAEGLEARMDRYTKFINEDKGLKTEAEKNLWVDKQVYIALSNMLTMSAALGVDSTALEGYEREPIEKILTERGVYNPDDFHLAVMVCFGHSDSEHRPKTRQPMEEVLTVFD